METFDLSGLVGRLQDAALTRDRWPAVFDEVSRSVGAVGAHVFSRHCRLPRDPASASLERWSREYHADGWKDRSERRLAVEHLRSGHVMVDQDFMTPESIARSAFYQDLLSRHGLAWVACVGFGIDNHVWGLAIHRGSGSEPYSGEDIRRLALLAPHLTDAATIACRLNLAHANGIVDACQRMRQPCVLFNGRGQVLALNRRADAIVGDMVGTDATLQFPHAESRDRFHRCLAAAIGPVLDTPAPTEAALFDRRGRAMSVHMTALRDRQRFPFVGARAMMLISRLWPETADEAETLRTRYGITRAEWQLVTELCRGNNLRAAGAAVRVTYQTARSTLKQVFAKTGTHRQAELVALLMRERV